MHRASLEKDVYFVSIVLLIAATSCQAAPTRQADVASPPTIITRCPPRPTLTPFPTPTPFTLTPKLPTVAPTKTPGPPAPTSTFVIPTLVQPLTEQEALKLALELDIRGATDWDDPWCLDTLRLQPGRIVIKWYPNEYVYEGTESAAANLGLDVAHSHSIWVVSIKGNVRLLPPFPCMGCTEPIKAGGVAYIIDQQTGLLKGIRTEPP